MQTLDYVTALLGEVDAARRETGSLPASVSLWLPHDVSEPSFAEFLGEPFDAGRSYVHQVAIARVLLLAIGIPVLLCDLSVTQMASELSSRGWDNGHSERSLIASEHARMLDPVEHWRLSLDAPFLASYFEDVGTRDADAGEPIAVRVLVERVRDFGRALERDDLRNAVSRNGLDDVLINEARGRLLRDEPMLDDDAVLYRRLCESVFGKLR